MPKDKRPRKGLCPKCETAAPRGGYIASLCGAYHTSNSCPMRSPPSRPSHVVLRGYMFTCGELLAWRDTGKLPAGVPPIPKCTLYRHVYNGDMGGYVVYRHLFGRKLTPMAIARAHRHAVFICEADAADYCRYRNSLVDRNGTDAIA